MHVTIDIETLGTNTTSNFVAMPSLALVYHPSDNVEDIPTILYHTFDVEDQINKGAVTTANTIAFWMQEASKETLASQEIIHILNNKEDAKVFVFCPHEGYRDVYSVNSNKVSLETLADAINTIPKGCPFYGNGSEFDNKILEAHFKEYNVLNTIPFWSHCSLRTNKDLAKYLGLDYKKDVIKPATDLTLDLCRMFSIPCTTAKHDPVYDALVESYELLIFKELIKLKS